VTPRQTEVLRLWCSGKFPKEIAAALNISYKGVAFHFHKIQQKIGKHPAQMIRWAMRHGLIQEGT